MGLIAVDARLVHSFLLFTVPICAMNRRFVIRALLFAGLHYVVLVLLEGFIYLLSHLPTAVLRLDGLILALTRVEQVLVFPRWALHQVGISGWMPYSLNWVFTFLNSLTWGFLLAAFKTWRERPR